jgi:hypothetical protein
MIGKLFGTAVCALLLASPVVAQRSNDGPEVRFVVLGHIRGDQSGKTNPKLGELLAEVTALKPQFAVLTGDIIWGDYDAVPPNVERVNQQWEQVDAALNTLGIPVYRVPGNHDISSPGTRDVWLRRYGSLPRSESIAGIRLLLLSSTLIPEDGDQRSQPAIRGVDLDEKQVRWLETELAKPSDEPTFAFTHHLLWWEADGGRWWTEVHPLLAKAGTKAVFSGDYGPLKFSTLNRDGVRYFQSSIETPVSLGMLQINFSSRVLSAQFDNFLEVIVRDGKSDVRVHPIGAITSGEFTPSRYNAIMKKDVPVSLWARLTDFVATPKRISALLIVGMALGFSAGWWGRRSLGRSSRQSQG